MIITNCSMNNFHVFEKCYFCGLVLGFEINFVSKLTVIILTPGIDFSYGTNCDTVIFLCCYKVNANASQIFYFSEVITWGLSFFALTKLATSFFSARHNVSLFFQFIFNQYKRYTLTCGYLKYFFFF